jgi:hypothetical protein
MSLHTFGPKEMLMTKKPKYTFYRFEVRDDKGMVETQGFRDRDTAIRRMAERELVKGEVMSIQIEETDREIDW